MEILKGIKDLWSKELPPLPESAEGTAIWPFTGSPREWIDPTHPDYTPSIYADRPTIDVTGSGQIKSIAGSAKGAVSALRKMISTESRLRGKPLKAPMDYQAFKDITGIQNDAAVKELWENFQKFSKEKSLPGTEMFEAWMSKNRAIQDMLKPRGEFLKKKGLIKAGDKVLKSYPEHKIKEKPLEGLVDEVSRGLWLHGRSKYPKTGETFADSRIRVGNLGEPYGLSLTADKALLEKSFAKHQGPEPPDISSEYTSKYAIWEFVKDKVSDAQLNDLEEELFGMAEMVGEFENIPTPQELHKAVSKSGFKEHAPFARVFPQFGGAPGEKILPAWVAPETEWAQKIIADAYIESLPDEVKAKLLEGVVKMKENFKDSPLSLADIMQDNPDVKGILEEHIELSDKVKNDFNKRISDNLQKKGYKALLYSPERFDEYEMRMLNPDDVMMLDMRTQEDPALQRMYRGPEVRHVDPKTKQLRKVQPGKQKQRLRKWREQAASREGASLRNIYEKITWEDIERILGEEPSNPMNDLDALISEADKVIQLYKLKGSEK